MIEQGKDNDKFCVIKSGSVKVVQKGGRGWPTRRRASSRSSRRQFFGERALLTGEKASSDVVAGDAGAKIFQIKKADFDRTVGTNMKTLLDKERQKRDEAAAKPDRLRFDDLELRRILGVGTFGRVKLVVHKPTGRRTRSSACARRRSSR